MKLILKREILEIVKDSLNGEWWELDEPPADVFEKGNELYIEIEIAGIDLRDTHVVYMGDRVAVYGVKKRTVSGKNVRYMRVERTFGRFKRLILLPVAVDGNKIRSVYKNGVLTVICKKRV
ncbi:MAG: Hsp20/alpha crystallin family protein [Deltaproteobacteria bacterium]|nr:Hsp20/alpha crystallin family protein [Deltaproteobacteria bacterium]